MPSCIAAPPHRSSISGLKNRPERRRAQELNAENPAPAGLCDGPPDPKIMDVIDAIAAIACWFATPSA
jgi:hypothetical protein